MGKSIHQENINNVPHEHRMHRTGSWLPSDHRVHKDWLEDIINKASTDAKDFRPVIKEFKDLIENNSRIYLLENSMFEEIPTKKPYSQDPVGHKQVRDYQHMLELFNHVRIFVWYAPGQIVVLVVLQVLELIYQSRDTEAYSIRVMVEHERGFVVVDHEPRNISPHFIHEGAVDGKRPSVSLERLKATADIERQSGLWVEREDCVSVQDMAEHL